LQLSHHWRCLGSTPEAHLRHTSRGARSVGSTHRPLPFRIPMGPIGNPRPRRGRRKLRRLMLPRAPPQVLHPAITCMCPVPYVHELTTHFNVLGYGYAPSFSYMGRPQPPAPQMFTSASHIGSFLIHSYILRTILPFQNLTPP
jgi:hypothetical protein